MKIVEVNAFHYPFLGGIEHRVHHIAKRLAVKHEVTVLTGQMDDTPLNEQMSGYAIKRVPSKYIDIYNPPYIKTPGLLTALEELKPDVVDFHYRWAPTYNKAARRYTGKKVFTFHNTYGEGVGITRLPSIANDFFWKSPLKKFSKIVCVSEFVKRDLEERGFEPSRLITVPNGIDLPPEGNFSEKDYILFVGRLVGTKGIPFLLRAMKDVDSKLVVCGGGPDLEKLKKMSEKFGVKDKVEFPGRVPEEKKLALFAGCKVFVLPSIYESYGIAAAEAMSYGKPVVASNVGGLPEVVGNGGLLANPRDPKDLAEKINILLKEPEKRKNLGKRAKELASEYTWNRSANMMEELYREVSQT
ncbi:MAG: glycosyltransferase family 4 protein [Thermoplasmata archaeon]|nr:glycosyltransferase family 4 protein [Thermoplasmata archaeon]